MKTRILKIINILRNIKEDFISMKQEKHAVKSIFQRTRREYTFLKYDCKNEKVSRNLG